MIGKSCYQISKLWVKHKLSYIALHLKNWNKTPFRKFSDIIIYTKFIIKWYSNLTMNHEDLCSHQKSHP